ncbi:MAG: T9SS type A sorting domain-containing protein [Saprospiraceae bacterium]|nr:T9SS type A sorting domain-containing protein [Saprospiraceae bacterium]
MHCPSDENCVLNVVNAESGECNSEDGFFIFFSLTHQNTGNQGFKIQGLNNNYIAQFNYGESRYKIGPFKGDCETKYRFKIFDIAHPDCLTEWSMAEPVCCGDGCLISGPDITKAECVNGLVDITLNFEHNNTSGSFTLKMNGQVRGTYQYQDLPIIIRNLEPKKVYSFFIKDNEKECSGEFAYTTPECSVSAEETIFSHAKVFRTGDDIMITLKNPGQKVTNVVLTDILGRQMYKTGFSGAEQNIPLGSTPTGIYFINLQNGLYTKTFKVVWSK